MKTYSRVIFCFLILGLLVSPAYAKIQSKAIEYKDGNAVHSFSNPASGNDNSKGAAYNEKADKRSWEAMRKFFKEIFGEKK